MSQQITFDIPYISLRFRAEIVRDVRMPEDDVSHTAEYEVSAGVYGAVRRRCACQGGGQEGADA